jgi:hypothetical protein
VALFLPLESALSLFGTANGLIRLTVAGQQIIRKLWAIKQYTKKKGVTPEKANNSNTEWIIQATRKMSTTVGEIQIGQ